MPPEQLPPPPGLEPSPRTPAQSSKWPDLVEDIFPASQVHLIGGCTGAGKTAFECWMMAHVLNGEPFLGHKTNPPTWYGALIFDRAAEERIYWWRQAGLSDIPHYCLTDDDSTTPEKFQKLSYHEAWHFLVNKIKALKPKPGGALAIDVASFFIPDAKMGYASAFARGWSLGRLARDMELFIMGVVHGSKPRSHDVPIRLTDRIIGGTGFLGTMGTQCYLATNEESGNKGYQEFEWRPHKHRAERFKLRRTPSGLYAISGAPDVLKPAEKVTRDDYLPLIPPEGSDACITTGELIQRVQGFWKTPARTVERDIARLEAEGKILRFQGKQGKWQKRGEAGEEMGS